MLKRIVGFDLLADLAEFFRRLQRHGRRLPGARQARQQTCSPTRHTCFLVVCGPQGEPIDEAVYFHRKLVEAKLPFGGVIVNKVHYPAEHLRGDDPELPRRPGQGARRRGPGAAGLRELRRLPGAGRARRRQHRAARRRRWRSRGVIRVPYLDEDVHDLAGLAEINRYLFASSAERTALAAGLGD